MVRKSGKKMYIPRRGDLLWINLNPQKGREQKGKRPALVISHKIYNAKTGLALMCPITSKAKGYPFEIVLSGAKIKGVVLADQLRTLDWQTRGVSFIGKAEVETLAETQEKIMLLISGE